MIHEKIGAAAIEVIEIFLLYCVVVSLDTRCLEITSVVLLHNTEVV